LPKDREEIWSTLEMSFSIFFKKTWIKKRYRVLLEMLQGSFFRSGPFKIQPSKELFARLVGSPIDQPTRKRVDRGP
jgi:hypothetical protein